MAATASAPPSTQCAYETWNSTTNCWNYRPCDHCLQTPGCMIGQSGMCEPLDRATAQHNYTRAFALNLTLPAAKDTMNDTMKRVIQQWEFPSSSALYCGTEDATCKQCIAEKFWMNGLFDSRFCVGANGCVCISTCEFSSLQQPTCDAEPAETAPAVLPTFQQCQYASQDRNTGCSTKRSCRDCLTKTGCRIAMDGFCEPDSDVNFDSPEQFDYRLALTYNLSLPGARDASALGATQYWHFPATKLEYCPTSDPTCQQCVQENYWLGPGRAPDSRFCVGADGCVCVANCARDDTATQCPQPSAALDYNDSNEDWRAFGIFITLLFIGLGVFLIGCVWCLCCCCKKRRRKRWEDVQVARIVGPDEVATPGSANTAPMYVVVQPA